MGITWIFTVEVIFHFGVTSQVSGRTPIWIYAYRTWQSSWVCLILTDKLVSPRRDFKRLLGFSDDVRLWSRCSAVSPHCGKLCESCLFYCQSLEECHDYLPCWLSISCEKCREEASWRGRQSLIFFFFCQRT